MPASAATPAPASASDASLGGVLQRLQRLEQQAQQLHHPRPPTNIRAVASPYSTLPSPPVVTPSFSDGTTSLSTSAQQSKLDVTSVLSEAIDQVRRHKQIQNARDLITGTVHVPPELAKSWIDCKCLHPHSAYLSLLIYPTADYLRSMETDIFPSLINQKLLRMVPDLISEPHIHIDISMQILYYVVCFHGYMLATSVSRQEREYANSCYVGCLRAIPQWKKEARGSTTDFAAAFLLVSY